VTNRKRTVAPVFGLSGGISFGFVTRFADWGALFAPQGACHGDRSRAVPVNAVAARYTSGLGVPGQIDPHKSVNTSKRDYSPFNGVMLGRLVRRLRGGVSGLGAY